MARKDHKEYVACSTCVHVSAADCRGRHKDLPAWRHRRRAQCDLSWKRRGTTGVCYIRWTSGDMHRLDDLSVRRSRVQKHENVRVLRMSRRLRTQLQPRQRVLLSRRLRRADVYAPAQAVRTLLDVAAAPSRSDARARLRCAVVHRLHLTRRSHTRVWISYVNSNRMFILCCCRESCLM